MANFSINNDEGLENYKELIWQTETEGGNMTAYFSVFTPDPNDYFTHIDYPNGPITKLEIHSDTQDIVIRGIDIEEFKKFSRKLSAF